MARQSNLDPDSSEPKAERPKTYYPITTQGKIALDKWRQSKSKNIPRERPLASESNKPRSLPPPGELTEVDKALKLRKTSDATRPARYYYKNKPLTTQEKIEAAKALERTRGHGHGEDWKPTQKVKIPGLAEQVKYLANWKYLDKPKFQVRDDVSVLVRRTRRSELWVSKHPTENFNSPKGTFRLLEIPTEVRSRIWKLVVVDESAFVWPESPTGREQPDIAMTCKIIREEVLPIFYGANTFGVVISPTIAYPQGGKDGDMPEQICGITTVHRWMTTLESVRNENGKWAKHIQHWAFQYTERNSSNLGGNVRGRSRSENFLVLVSLNNWAAGGTYKTPEVHQEAACVLQGWEECGACSPGQIPTQVKSLVRSVQYQAWKDQASRAELISALAMQLRDSRIQLVRARCLRRE